MGIRKIENIGGHKPSSLLPRRKRIIINITDALLLGEEYALTYTPDVAIGIVFDLTQDGLLHEDDAESVESLLMEELTPIYARAVVAYMLYDGMTYDNSHHKTILDYIFCAICGALTTYIELDEDTNKITLISDEFPVDIYTIEEYDSICEAIAVAMMESLDSMSGHDDSRYAEFACDLREMVLTTMDREIDPDDTFEINQHNRTIVLEPASLFKRIS